VELSRIEPLVYHPCHCSASVIQREPYIAVVCWNALSWPIPCAATRRLSCRRLDPWDARLSHTAECSCLDVAEDSI